MMIKQSAASGKYVASFQKYFYTLQEKKGSVWIQSSQNTFNYRC